MTPGEIVRWVTGDCDAVILRTTDYGDVVILPIGASVPITTRRCFLTPR